MSKWLVIFIVLFVNCEKVEKRQVAKLSPTEQKLEKIYHINANQKQQGYAHKYTWLNSQNKSRHHYFIHDLRGNLIGYIGNNGLTKKYDSTEQEIVMGNFDFDVALQRIFDTEVIFYSESEKINTIKKIAKKEKRELVDERTEEDIYEDDNKYTEEDDDEYDEDNDDDDEYDDDDDDDDEYDEDDDY